MTADLNFCQNVEKSFSPIALSPGCDSGVEAGDAVELFEGPFDALTWNNISFSEGPSGYLISLIRHPLGVFVSP